MQTSLNEMLKRGTIYTLQEEHPLLTGPENSFMDLIGVYENFF